MAAPHLKVQVAGTDKALAVEIANKGPVGVGAANQRNKKGAAIPLIVDVADHAALPVTTRKGETLAVSLGAAPLPVALTNAPPDTSGLPQDLCSGVIALRLGKKEVDHFEVSKTHGQWAFLTPVSVSGPHPAKAGWYHLPSVSSGPWTASVMPVAKSSEEEAEAPEPEEVKPSKDKKTSDKGKR